MGRLQAEGCTIPWPNPALDLETSSWGVDGTQVRAHLDLEGWWILGNSCFNMHNLDQVREKYLLPRWDRPRNHLMWQLSL